MVLRLVTLALAQALDLVTFKVMVGLYGPAAEANPLVAGVFRSSGLGTLVALKVAIVVLVGALAIAGASRSERRTWAVVGGLPLALAITIGIVGGITNASTILS